MPETVNIKINGQNLQVPKGELIIESAKRIGVEIPFFCYHPRLSMEDGGANCRMCLVQMGNKGPDGTVRVHPKPQTACSLPASEGLEIETETESIADDRRGILEFLLINHPLDCPICDRGGECPLQNNTIFYGPQTTRFIEEKRHFPKAYPLSEHVVFDRERCIHCARCTRFTTDISGDSQLNFLFRGAEMEVGTFQDTRYNSKFSGNVIELCPVGALLSRNYRFKARPWDLQTQRSICTQCSNGCNIKLDYRVSELQRVNARLNEAVNEEWTCDKGKFGMDYVSSPDRLMQPMIKKNGALHPATWEEANHAIIAKLRDAGTAVGGIGGTRSSNEDLYVWQKLFRQTLGVNNLDHRMGPHFPAANAHHGMGNAIADLEKMKAILVFGDDLDDEQPIVFLRIRKAWRWNHAAVVYAHPAGREESDSPNRIAEFAKVTLTYKPGTEAALIRTLIRGTKGENLSESAASECGVSLDGLNRAAGLLATQDMAIVAGSGITAHPQADSILEALGDLAEATGNAGNLNIPATECNQQGAMDMGILPDSLPGYHPAQAPGMNSRQMLESAVAADLKVLWISGIDLVNRFYGPELARTATEACPFVIANELFLTETAQLADVVLPIQSVAERDGTFTNCERRVQRFWKAFEVGPQIRPEWLVFSQIAAEMGGSPPYFSAKEIMAEIAGSVEIYRDCTYQNLGDQGIRWSIQTARVRPPHRRSVRSVSC